MMEKKSKNTLLVLTLIGVVALSTLLLRAQTSHENNDQLQTEAQLESQNSRGSLNEAQAQRVEGSWDIVVSPNVPPGVPQPPSFNVFGTFAQGSAFIGSDRNGPSPQHGVWQHLGGNRFAFSFRQNLFDKMGNFTGVFKVNAQLRLTGNDTFVGTAKGEQRDLSGNLVPPFGCVTLRGTRIRIEPLLCP